MSGEHQHSEWKENWRDDYLRHVCGFANARGGVLVIGRNDHGEPVGVTNAAKLLEDLPNKIRDLLGIIVDIDLQRAGDNDILEIHVPAYANPISYRGHYYQRSGSTLQELKGASLDRFLLRSQGRTWDSVPAAGIRFDQLSGSAIGRFRTLAAASGRLDASDLEVEDAALLEKLKLTEDGHLRRAAVLLFHDDPTYCIPGAFVKIGYFRTEAELGYHDEVHGNLLSQAQASIDLVLTKYLKAAIGYEGIQRIERYPVPRDALREALLNALVHRDYAVPAPIQIRVYDDRLKIWNPAVLPDGWDVRKLLGEHPSHPYNPNVANAFFRAGEIEAWGRGIRRMFLACRQAGVPEPEIRLTGNDLWLEFPFAPEYLLVMQAAASDRPVSDMPGKTSVETSVKTSVKTPERIMAAMRDNPEYTLAEVAEIVGRTTRAVEMAVSKLNKAGKIRYVGPAKGGHWEVIE